LPQKAAIGLLYGRQDLNFRNTRLMKPRVSVRSFELIVLLVFSAPLLAESWVDESNEITRLFLHDQASDFIIRDVGISRPLALQEIDRYTFRAPGQATSYYYGYMHLMALRTEVELRLRDKFNQQKYHDFLLAQGMLPPDILRQSVLEGFIPKQ
jgi:hypothetical protein